MKPPHVQTGTISGELFDEMEKLEGKKSDAFLEWKRSKIILDKTLSTKWIEFKTDGEKKTGDHLDALVDTDPECIAAKMDEAAKETIYRRLEDRLMSVRQMISFRGY